MRLADFLKKVRPIVVNHKVRVTGKVIGRGANGVVLRNGKLAIKITSGSSNREARTLKKLQKLSFVPRIHESVKRKSYTAYSMNLISGITYRKWAKRATLASKKKVLAKIRRYLTTLHRMKILHGDLHDENILVNPRTLQVWIIDFTRSRTIRSTENKFYSRYRPIKTKTHGNVYLIRGYPSQKNEYMFKKYFKISRR